MISSTERAPVNDTPELTEAYYGIWPPNLYAAELQTDPILKLNEVNGTEGIFNVTPLIIDGLTYLFGRQVYEAAPWGLPDSGPLILGPLDAYGNMQVDAIKIVWDPDGKSYKIEDPRALQTPNSTAIGVTVVSETDGRIRPFPGLIKLGSPKDLLDGPFPQVRRIEKFGEGSQTTPLNGQIEGKNSTSITENEIMYRPEAMNHTLQVLDCSKDDAQHVAFIDFPQNIPYATYKIGTTSPPELINEQSYGDTMVCEYFFKFHGLNKTIDGNVVDPHTEDERMIYEYAGGTARLLRIEKPNGTVLFRVDNISRKPILNADSFPDLGDDRQVELHPDKRRAVYLCGSIPTRNSSGNLISEELFPNQGDMRTWTAVLDTDAIIASWDRTLPNLD